MADRFNRIDNTAPVVDVAENQLPETKKSLFDWNRKIITQALPYAIIPIDCIPTLPNTEAILNYDIQVSFRNPAIRKMLNGWRIYTHAYYNRYSDLWEGWNNFITKGRSGTMTLKIPHIATRFSDYTPFTPMSLYNYLGFPSEAIPTTGGSPKLNKYCGVTLAQPKTTPTGLANYENIEISAMKPMMYQRLWRDKYSPKNLLQENKHLFPDNEDHFILSYEADKVTFIEYEQESDMTLATGGVSERQYYTMEEPNIPVRLDCLRFRQFQGDRFTTASPFPEMLRGLAPALGLDLDLSEIVLKENSINLDTQSVVSKIENGENEIYDERITQLKALPKASNADASSGTTNVYIDNSENGGTYGLLYSRANMGTSNDVISNYITNSKALTGVLTDINGNQVATVKSTVTLSQLRSLEVFTLFAERMARTNGDYNEMIKAQFGYNPKYNNREAIYIGGSYQDIVLNSIYQTSETTNESALGRQVANGNSASYNKLGRFKADDYGMIMVVMSIVPDTIYTTGISKLDTALTMEEQYFPIMNNLSAEPILNQELYVSGNEEEDKDVWGYAERFSEWKSRRNHVSGFSELPNTLDEFDSALVMARRFNQTPNYNANFVQGYPSNYSLDGFTSYDEPPFDVAIRQDVSMYYPMPYTTIPQGLGTRA